MFVYLPPPSFNPPPLTARSSTEEERRSVRRGLGARLPFVLDVAATGEVWIRLAQTSARSFLRAESAWRAPLAAAETARTESERDSLAGALALALEKTPTALDELERTYGALARGQRVALARALGIVRVPDLRGHSIRILNIALRDPDPAVQNSSVDAFVDQRGADALSILERRLREGVPASVSANLRDAIEYLRERQ